MRYRLLGVVAVCLATLASSPGRAAAPEVVAKGFGFVEGPIFVGNDLYFVDYNSSRVLRVRDTQVQTVWRQDGCGANGLAELNGTLFVACYDNATVAMISAKGVDLGRIRQDQSGRGFVAPNDFALDAKDGVYFSASGFGDKILGRVLYRRSDGAVAAVADGIPNANGLVTSRDGRSLYVASSKEDTLYIFDISADGSLSNKRLFVDLDALLKDDGAARHIPDGVRSDRNGNIFVGLFDGGGFVVLNPDGKLLTAVALPGTHHANLAISPDGTSIYATSVSVKQDGSVDGQILRIANPMP